MSASERVPVRAAAIQFAYRESSLADHAVDIGSRRGMERYTVGTRAEPSWTAVTAGGWRGHLLVHRRAPSKSGVQTAAVS